jgi:hypothetical protein
VDPLVYGLGLAKDEADVLEQSVLHALTMCDKVFYIDNWSTDASWSIICELAQRYPGRVIPYQRTAEPYAEGMRNRIVNDYSSELGRDGWWMKLDADEFLDSDPRPLMKAAIRSGHDSIRCWQVQFAFTDIDLDEWLAGNDDRSRPIHLRRRYYEAAWREVRMWRNTPGRPWTDVTLSHPEWIRRPTRESLFNRHYQYRDPQQIQRRLELRYGNDLFPHEMSPDWRSVVRPAAGLRFRANGEPWRHSPLRYYRAVLPAKIRTTSEAAARLLVLGGT